jgi:hypothetical protein
MEVMEVFLFGRSVRRLKVVLQRGMMNEHLKQQRSGNASAADCQDTFFNL